MKKQKSKEFNDELHELMKKHDINIYENGGIENILLEAVAPLLEKTLNAEMDEHLGNSKHESTTNGNY
jgi:transposase-like protein